MRTFARFGALTIAIAAALGLWWLRSVAAADLVTIRPGIEVLGASPQQLAMARWAVERFEAAGLNAPAVVIEFHRGRSGCGGHLGFARSEQVEVCNALVNAMSRRTLLHEISHVWLDQNATRSTKARFLQSRGLPSWNAWDDAWRLRGFEQGAETIAWALGERILSAQIPDNNPERMAEAYRMLTGLPLPESQALGG